ARRPARRRAADHDRPRRDHLLRAPRVDRRHLPHPARRGRPALRAVLLGLRRRLRGGRAAAAARRLPPDVDDLPAPHPPRGVARRRRPARAQHRVGLPDGRLARARDLGHVRHRLRRPPGPHPDPHAGRLGGPPAAQGLPARRDPGRVQGGGDPAAGSAEVVHVSSDTFDAYAPQRETTEGTVYTVTGGDWDTLIDEEHDDRIIINMGPQHPSTHGVLRLVLELEGETVQQARSVIGYLHTGIEKNCEYRTWTQGVTFVTRMDYLSPLFNETAYCLGVEKLLGVEAPRRAQIARVLLMELTRIGSHLVCLATGGMELGALTGMTAGFREREEVLHLMEFLTGLRMNNAFVRPGGLAQDFPEGWEERVADFLKVMKKRLPDYDKLLTEQPIWRQRLEGVGYLPIDGCIALGATGPILR